MSKNIKNSKEINNMKLESSFQSLVAANDLEDTINEVSDRTLTKQQMKKLQ